MGWRLNPECFLEKGCERDWGGGWGRELEMGQESWGDSSGTRGLVYYLCCFFFATAQHRSMNSFIDLQCYTSLCPGRSLWNRQVVKTERAVDLEEKDEKQSLRPKDKLYLVDPDLNVRF